MEEVRKEKKKASGGDNKGMIGISEKFALMNKLITRDMNSRGNSPSLSLFTKDDITTYLSRPATNEANLRKAVIYMYGASPHFRRLIQYFAGLTDLSFFVSPYGIDPSASNVSTVNRNYRKVLNTMSSMNVRSQFPKILTTCLREDVFYGTMWVTTDSIIIQQLPSDFCSISSIEQNVLNATFDFSYFDSRQELLEFYPDEFNEKYKMYLSDRTKKWIELDSPKSFAIKCNNDILDYAMPPFAGILREVYDLEDYKQLKLSKTELENYAMIDMKLPMDKEGNWLLDYDKAVDFWRNLDSVLPEEIGSVLTPMDIDKTTFERPNSSNSNVIAEAEQNLFTAAGVSSLLFNNEKASANALSLSIKADQSITYGIVKSIEDMVNRFIQSQSFGKKFKVTFIDSSPFNRKEVGDQYLKGLQYGLPTVTMYAASQGLSQSEFDLMNFLETDVLGLKEKLSPLRSSNTLSSKDGDEGRPKKDADELSDSREKNEESE